MIYAGPNIKANSEIEARLQVFCDKYFDRFYAIRVVGRLVSGVGFSEDCGIEPGKA